jgi:hypothetical protein
MQTALYRSVEEPGELDFQLHELRNELFELEERMFGHQARESVGEKTGPTFYNRLRNASRGVSNSTYGPSETQRRSLELAKKEFEDIKPLVKEVVEERIPELERKLAEAGAPWIEGQEIPR